MHRRVRWWGVWELVSLALILSCSQGPEHLGGGCSAGADGTVPLAALPLLLLALGLGKRRRREKSAGEGEGRPTA